MSPSAISHLPSPIFRRCAAPPCNGSDLALVLCHFNPCGYWRPYLNFLLVWMKHRLAWPNVYTIGLYTPGTGICRRVGDLTLTSPDSLFQKEHLWNLAAERLVPERFEKILFLDADVYYLGNPPYAAISAALDSFAIVQPWARAFWHDDRGQVIGCRPSCAAAMAAGVRDFHDPRHAHPGFGFAVRRSFFREVGGFPPGCIIGGGDIVTVLGVTGRFTYEAVYSEQDFYLSRIPRRLFDQQYVWSLRAQDWSGGALGHVRADLVHLWHGDRLNRAYNDRYSLIADYHPTDLARNPRTGLVEWSPRARITKRHMVNAVADYFRTRKEDATRRRGAQNVECRV